jgi:hypothetical protein
MDRRDLLGVLGVGAVGLIAAPGREARAQHPHHHGKLHGDCLKACEACATVCNETFHHCFYQVKDGHADHHPTAVLTIACLACADACKLCATECSKHDDPQMKECVAACRACETACRAMAKAIGEGSAKAKVTSK